MLEGSTTGGIPGIVSIFFAVDVVGCAVAPVSAAVVEVVACEPPPLLHATASRPTAVTATTSRQALERLGVSGRVWRERGVDTGTS